MTDDIQPGPPAPDQTHTQTDDSEETLNQLSALPANWNSYGAPPISPEAIAEARLILLSTASLNLPAPWLAPGGDAGVGIQWTTPRAELYIDIVPGQATTYDLTPTHGRQPVTEGILTTRNLPAVLSQLAEPAE